MSKSNKVEDLMKRSKEIRDDFLSSVENKNKKRQCKIKGLESHSKEEQERFLMFINVAREEEGLDYIEFDPDKEGWDCAICWFFEKFGKKKEDVDRIKYLEERDIELTKKKLEKIIK